MCDRRADRSRALTFCIDRNSTRYVGGLTWRSVPTVLAHAPWLARLDGRIPAFDRAASSRSIGIHDRNLWQLQRWSPNASKRL